jgi:hypothetical protein
MSHPVLSREKMMYSHDGSAEHWRWISTTECENGLNEMRWSRLRVNFIDGKRPHRGLYVKIGGYTRLQQTLSKLPTCTTSSSFNTPPQSQPLWRLRLYLNWWSFPTGSGLVNPSATWSPELINLISNSFAATRSRTKWKSISMCLVLAWKTGLAER